MIPEIYVEQWRNTFAWQTLSQIEQDLIISRTLINLFNEPYLKDVLVFRGGTALNKLFLKSPARYSEDIDLVQKRSEPIGKTIDTIRDILTPWLGEAVLKITQRSAKLVFKYEAINKLPAKLKIEINTTEHFQVLPLFIKRFEVQSDWFSVTADVVTYEIEELMATKLRALYQRRKGRDLFDLWYVTKQNLIDVNKTIEIFTKYCSNDDISIRGEEFIKNLDQKKCHQDFRLDMDFLLPQNHDWAFDTAYQFVIEQIIRRIQFELA
ncbi:MAG: nucleotidyl transferase AbiEii/AbiGii toxin family protein [Holosporales bacterium]|jgi:predicted nucleotidyltransferase component of viral defense system|nr:nucleotidyl transferase AbiEii/AbiGii toxin family protein [Holosporales bacterium]